MGVSEVAMTPRKISLFYIGVQLGTLHRAVCELRPLIALELPIFTAEVDELADKVSKLVALVRAELR